MRSLLDNEKLAHLLSHFSDHLEKSGIAEATLRDWKWKSENNVETGVNNVNASKIAKAMSRITGGRFASVDMLLKRNRTTYSVQQFKELMSEFLGKPAITTEEIPKSSDSILTGSKLQSFLSNVQATPDAASQDHLNTTLPDICDRNNRSEFNYFDGSYLKPTDRDFIGFFDIDKEVFSGVYGDLNESLTGTPDLSWQWFQKNPLIYTFVTFRSKVVGYCNLMPLTEDCYNSLIKGEIGEGEIRASDLMIYLPGFYSLYCCGVCILEEHRDCGRTFTRLFKKIQNDIFFKLSDEGVFFTSLGAASWNDWGCSACELLGLNYIGPGKNDCGKIFHTRLDGKRNTRDRSFLSQVLDYYEQKPEWTRYVNRPQR